LDGKRVTLTPVGYEFAAPSRKYRFESDVNWLQIRLQVDDPQGVSCDRTAPCLYTWSLLGVARWLRDVADGDGEPGWYYPSEEPNLAFGWEPDEQLIILRLLLSQEFSPTGSFLEYELRLRCRPGALRRFADALEADAARFPIRTWGDDASTQRIAKRFNRPVVRL
jgi:hypothetical protein